MANEGGKINKFGVSEKTWLAVTADDMRKRFPNNKNDTALKKNGSRSTGRSSDSRRTKTGPGIFRPSQTP